jgi:DNA polymerase-3 subunit epsilon
MGEPWASGPFLAVDTETTGVDPASDRIVEAAAVEILPDCTIGATWSAIIDPGVDIPTEAAQVHGITTARARAEGIAPVDALRQLGERIAAHPGPVVIYNARFDWPLLVTEADRHGLVWPDAPLLDPLVLDKHLDRYRKGSRRLTVVAAWYGVVLTEDDAHGALADAIAAGRTMRAMVDRSPEMAATPIDAMQLWQERWFDDQQASFADYMRRTKDPLFTAHLGWPCPTGIAA